MHYRTQILYLTLIAVTSNFSYSDSQTLDSVRIQGEQINSFSTESFSGNQTSVDLAEYEKQFHGLDEILAEQAGIDIASVSGVGQYATPIIRGAEGQQVLVFQDGLLVNDLSGSAADIGSIPLSGISSLEIYRGFVPMELSPTAIGGAVNLVSEEHQENLGQTSVTSGSYGLTAIAASQHISLQNSNIAVSVNKTHADNDFIYTELSPISDPNTPKDEPRYNNGTYMDYARVRYRHSLPHQQSLTLLSHYKKQLREIAGNINSNNNHANIENELYIHQAKYQLQWGEKQATSFELAAKKNSEIFDDRRSKIGLGQQYNQYKTKLNKIAITHSLDLKQHRFVINQQIQGEDIEINHLNYPNSNSNNCLISGVCDSKHWRRQYSTGARWEWIPTEKVFTSHQLVHLSNSDKLDGEMRNKSGIAWFSGLSYQILPFWETSINLSKQIRPPASTELLGDRGNIIGNSELKSEKATSLEMGVESVTSRVSGSIYFFKRYVTDNIYAQQDSSGVLKYENLSKTSYNGMEFNLNVSPIHGVFYKLNLTQQVGVIEKDENHALKGNQIGDHRTELISHSLDFQFEKIKAGLNQIIAKGGYFDYLNLISRDTSNRISAYTTITWNQATLSFQIKNITNDRVRDYPLTPVAGRTYYSTLSYEW